MLGAFYGNRRPSRACPALAGPWLLGDRLTQADITVATMLGFLRLAEPATGIAPPDEEHWRHLKRLAERCEAEAAFAVCFPPETERPLPPGFHRA